MCAAQFSRFGEPSEVLAVTDIAESELTPGRVCIRMLTSPINPSDLMTVRGVYGKLPGVAGRSWI